MKKLFITLSAVIMALSLNATDIWTGSKYVTWGQGLQIEAAQFVGAQPGNLLKVHFTGATDGIEFKVMKEGLPHLPGSCKGAWINGDGAYEQFLTKTAIDSLKAYGLEISGANFTCTQVELLDGKKDNLKDGFYFWTGFRWIENDKTYEFYYEGLNIDWSKYKELVIYHEAGRSDYAINIRRNWDDAGIISDGGAHETKYNDKLVLDLTEIDVNGIIATTNADVIMFQCFVPAAFNMTDIVLVPKTTPTAIDNTNADAKTTKILRNGQVLILRDGKTYNTLGVEVK